jgi:bifunctional non-homologous end joining protein LigD
VPTGRQWAYEIKHDGFRFLAVRQHERVRVFSRGGPDWSKQLPAVADALQALPVRSVVLDGEGVICGPDGKSDFDRLRACFSRHGAPEAFLFAFDLLELDGRDLRNEPWARRRATLAQLLTGAEPGIRLSEHIEDADGAVVFRQACTMGLEGIVAKRRDSRYRSGRCRDWIKIKNPAHAAIERDADRLERTASTTPVSLTYPQTRFFERVRASEGQCSGSPTGNTDMTDSPKSNEDGAERKSSADPSVMAA